MKLSYNWLRELSGCDWTPERIAERLTLSGVACEGIDSTSEPLEGVIVAEVMELEPVAGASKIQKATVRDGTGRRSVICGAPNVAVGQHVPLATPGAMLAGGKKIEVATIRGVESHGMLCSESELGLAADASGLLVLPAEMKPGEPLARALGLEDYTLTFEITPNRPDLLSAIGIARELCALAGTPLSLPSVHADESTKSPAHAVHIELEDPSDCPRYAARVITDVRVSRSPWWLRSRLIACGSRPISNVVDITNLVMLERGQPLHGFDFTRFDSDRVHVRRARPGEKFVTLDGKSHELTPEVLLITNGREPVALAGVMGGANSEVDNATTQVLLESAYFSPTRIRRSRKMLDKSTDASLRFEKGTDPNGVMDALNRAAQLIRELAGGKISPGTADAYPHPIGKRAITLRKSRVTQVVGVEFASQEIAATLTSLGCEVDDKSGNEFSVLVPTWRPDLEREIDLIEEIVRIPGYDALPESSRSKGPLVPKPHAHSDFMRRTRDLLVGAGFDEILWHGLVDSRRLALVTPDEKPIRVANPVSVELDCLRTSLVPSLLNVMTHNVSHGNIDLRLFEFGSTFHHAAGKTEPDQIERLVIGVSGTRAKTWRADEHEWDFHDLTAAVDFLAGRLRWRAHTLHPTRVAWLEPKQSFEIRIEDTAVGYLGRLERKLQKSADLVAPAFVVELRVDPMLFHANRKPLFTPLPSFPAAPRDLAAVVDTHVNVEQMLIVVRATAGGLAESIRIFDVYTGKPIPDGKKSVAFSVSYRSSERSLSGQEVDEIQRQVGDELTRQFNATIRDK